MITTLDIQKALKAAGHDPGLEDGAWGPLTRGAVEQFQRANGLMPDGIVGPQTRAALFKTRAATKSQQLLPPWFQEAERHLGLREIKGGKSNRTIMDWADDLDLHYKGDDVPWCGLFTAHAFHVGAPEDPQPSNPLGARNWATFGKECDPIMGACLVFWRTHRTNSWNGHVGFYAGERKDAFLVLGGNQSDSVSRAWIEKSRLLAARWPASVAVFGEKKTVKGSGATGGKEH